MGRLMNSVPGRVLRKFLEDQAPNWAALIAWNTLFAMFPIVLFTASILGFVLKFSGEANSRVYTIIFSAIPAGSTQQEDLLKAVSGVKSQSGLFFVVGLVTLLWGGSALFGVMEQAFAVIYHTKPRDFIQQKLISFGMVLLFSVLVGVAVATSALLPALKHIPDIPSVLYSGGADVILQALLGIVAGFLLFLTIFYVIPNRKQELRKVLPGAILSAVLFELVTLVFPLYLTLNKGINQYGATFALLFVLMTFFLLLGFITMVGVELNSVIYPVEIEQPLVGETLTSAPKTAADGRGKRVPAATEPSANGGVGPIKSGIRARTAVLMAVGASLVGAIVGRRSAGTD
jgi:YihY family inner membrane protein